ncbi:MAG: hypothetical protein KBT47_03050 [Armatimonadetes bacterium]|nr:hypothetical protein [Candidatus Hippobium faecium]
MKVKVLTVLVCVETVVICFFVFGLMFQIRHFRHSFRHMPPPPYSADMTYEALKLNEEQEKEFDIILSEFMKEQDNVRHIMFDDFRLLNRLVASPTATDEEIISKKKIVEEGIGKSFVSSVDYLMELKNILDEDQKIEFYNLIKKKEMYKLMPAPGFGHRDKYFSGIEREHHKRHSK